MEIIYPPLVEQGARFYQNLEKKAELYRAMVEKRVIYENGSPTPEAIENGWVKDFYEDENLSFEEFLVIYPFFKTFDPTVFQQIDGFWEIPMSLKKELLGRLVAEEFDYDERLQIEGYLADR